MSMVFAEVPNCEYADFDQFGEQCHNVEQAAVKWAKALIKGASPRKMEKREQKLLAECDKLIRMGRDIGFSLRFVQATLADIADNAIGRLNL